MICDKTVELRTRVCNATKCETVKSKTKKCELQCLFTQFYANVFANCFIKQDFEFNKNFFLLHE